MTTWFTRTSAALPAAMLALLLNAGAAVAGTQWVDGSFTNDDDLWRASFDLVQADTLSVTTYAYAGSASRGVAAGGFAPVLTLFEASAGLLQVAQGNAACSNAGAPGSPQVGFCWDASLTLVAVNAGHYTLVLSQDGNNALGQSLAEGFSQAGMPDYTSLYNGVPGSHFIQVDGVQRSGHYALEISAPLSPAVPEPGTPLMLLAGLAGLGLASRLRRCAAAAPHRRARALAQAMRPRQR